MTLIFIGCIIIGYLIIVNELPQKLFNYCKKDRYGKIQKAYEREKND